MDTIAVLGTGVVGQTLARRLGHVGYDVVVGAREAGSPSLASFATMERVRTGSFGDAVEAGDIVVNATNGQHSIAALDQVGASALAGATILDVSNELIPVEGGFPKPAATADDSLGQRIQAAFPDSHVVKALNTMNCEVMADPSIVPGEHVVFLSGDDAAAKDEVRQLLRRLGWRDSQMLDLGGIDSAAAVEMMMAVWMRVTIARGQGAPRFNWAVQAP
jgi:hypothetical protein